VQQFGTEISVANYQRKTDPAIDRRGRPPKNDSEVTSELLASGEATVAQIAQLFNTDAKTLPRRMKGIVPKGTRRGYKVFNIAEAASRIITPGYEIEEFIRQMSPQEMPVLLSKEFWNGQNARINYEKALGNLWPTEDVVEALGEFANVVRITLLLVPDDVDREISVTDGQRDIIRRIMHAAVDTLKKNIAEKFKDYHANSTDHRRAGTEQVLESSDFTLDGQADDLDGNILAAEDDEEEDFDI
jgi:hypothetical protein